MSNVFCGFIDAGYLRAQGSRACGIPGGQAQLRASACVGWLQDVLPSHAVGVAGLRFLRAYWLAQLADKVIEIPQDNLAAIVTSSSRREPNQAGDLVTSGGTTEAGPRP